MLSFFCLFWCDARSVLGVLFWNWPGSLHCSCVWLPCLAQSALCNLSRCIISGPERRAASTSETRCSEPGGITSIVQNSRNQLQRPRHSQNATQPCRPPDPRTRWGPTKGLLCVLAAFPQVNEIFLTLYSYCPCLLSVIPTRFHGLKLIVS